MQQDLEPLVKMLSKLPGLGPRSARRSVLYLMKKPQSTMIPLADTIRSVAEKIKTCGRCGNIDTQDPCEICRSAKRSTETICVVVDIDDLWAIERTHSYKGVYHILGGTLSALDGVRPDDLSIEHLLNRLSDQETEEVILALPATVDGQTTAHYIVQEINKLPIQPQMSHLAHGVPVGGELNYLDEGTLTMAMEKRRII